MDRYINGRGRRKNDDWRLKRIKTVPDDPAIIAKTLLEMNVIPHPTVMMRRTWWKLQDCTTPRPSRPRTTTTGSAYPKLTA
ncbi:MAG: hypothetical protein JXQ30_13640 [Spirochaetes bacterium]|nr:hypothetical protein [Spirochaetota bacterium]